MRRIVQSLLGYSSYKYTLPLAIALVGAATLEKENGKTNFKFPNSTVLMPQTTFYSSPKRYFVSYCEENAESTPTSFNEESEEPTKPVEPIVIEDASEEEDKKWEEEKQHCSFCRSFLQSPCKEPFKKWSKCVDRAKVLDVAFIEACQVYTRALMSCTKKHDAYFLALKEQMSEQSEEEDEEGEEVVESESSEGEAVVEVVEEVESHTHRAETVTETATTTKTS